ncbi:hypothetical protein LQZ21_08755 [Treponema sp. TIM-1]|uniref:hypothetical protein n=1 Tax=Treponema sp. TIM-1 TaxID=2898417 RepID=UPI003980B0DE
MKKGLIFWLMAVLSAVFLVIGCSQATDDDSGTIMIGERLVDIEVATETALIAALLNPDYQIIGFKAGAAATFSTLEEIPVGKTVILFSEVTPTNGLEVNGTLVVEGGGTLSADSSHRVRVIAGNIEVINGMLSVNSVVDIHGKNIEIQILGTGKAYFNGGTLEIKSGIRDLSDVKTAFSWVPKGTVLLSTVAITQPIKPSELTQQVPTTALRRLTISLPLVNNTSDPDTAETITVPAGMTFTTADPLPALKNLTVAGNLTASVATFNRLENLTVSGTLTANAALFNNVADLTVAGTLTATAATYDKVKTLVVDGTFNTTAATKAAFNSLESLTVNPGGTFTTTKDIGSNATDAAGITIVIKPEDKTTVPVTPPGSATVGVINKLRTSVIEGSLEANGFSTFDTNATLTAAEGGTINGVTFPAVTRPITAITAAAGPLYTVTIDDYTVPRDGELRIGSTSTLIIPTGKVLTIEAYGDTAGSGKINAQGAALGGTIVIDGVQGYTTVSGGVAGDKLRPAVVAIKGDTDKLTNAIDLKATFFTLGTADDYLGIGSITVSGTTADDVLDDGVGNGGTAIELTAGTVVGETSATGKDGTNAADIAAPANIKIKTSAGTPNKLQLIDADYDGSGNVKKAILIFNGVKLQNNGLINPTEVPAFSIGVSTKRT